VTASLISVIVAVLGAGGLVGAIVALVKLRPESGQIVVTAAQGALIVQTGVIDTLQRETARQQARIDAVQIENNQLRVRIAALETELHNLRDEVHRNGHR
jgi:capsule polysaccharide export protein KpsE/RkpR